MLISNSAKTKALKTPLHWDNSKLQGEIMPADNQCEAADSQRTSRDRECLNTTRTVGTSTSYCSLSSCIWAVSRFRTALEHPDPTVVSPPPGKNAEKTKVSEIAGWGRARLHPYMAFLGMVSIFPHPQRSSWTSSKEFFPLNAPISIYLKQIHASSSVIQFLY